MATVTNSKVHQDMDAVTRPDPRTYSPRILCWILFWPWNLAWSVCVNNPFRYMGQFIVRLIRSTFEEISSGEFKSIEAELSLDQPPEPPAIRPRAEPAYIVPVVPIKETKPASVATSVVESEVSAEKQVAVKSPTVKSPTVVSIPERPEVPAAQPVSNQDARGGKTTQPVEQAPKRDLQPSTNPSSTSNQRWSPIANPYESRSDESASSMPSTSRVMPSGSSDDSIYSASSADANAESPAVPDPLLYIKQDASEPAMSSSPPNLRPSDQPDPWFAKADPN
jgi:hypothetical protein